MHRIAGLLLLPVIVLVLTGCGSGSSVRLSAGSISNIQAPAYLPGPLNGESTSRNLAMRRVLAVVLENYAPDSRPQIGLSQASTVIETLAEGGISRFMALYLEGDASRVGPVRSTRLYFDQWASGLHAILAHAGGNDDAQALLWHLPKVFNIDENRTEINIYNTGTNLFSRGGDRPAPHNLYTDAIALRAFAARSHQDWPYTQAYLLHKQPASFSQRGKAGSLTIKFAEPLTSRTDPNYEVRYDYDRASNSYARFMGGTAHVDAGTHHQLRPANVILMRTGPAIADAAAGPTLYSILIPVLGKGNAWYFHDGKVTYGNWSQPNLFAPLRFYDSRGREEAFNPGQTWIEVAPSSSPATWTFR